MINRLSEDIDFRVVPKESCLSLGKDAKRRALRQFRHVMIDTLNQSGFQIQPDDISVFYEGRYMSIRAAFDGGKNIQYLKPHIAIDCFLGALELEPAIKKVSSMVKITLGDDACEHEYFPVACVALDETAAEKWVALSRRIIGAGQRPRDTDKHLVRHLYDLHELYQQNCLSKDYFTVLEKVFAKEQRMYGQILDFKRMVSLAIRALQSEKKWEDHWDLFLQQMVYQRDKATFQHAVESVMMLNSR